jgi:hypothetical protein
MIILMLKYSQGKKGANGINKGYSGTPAGPGIKIPDYLSYYGSL